MRRVLLAVSLSLVGALASACGSSTQTVTAPSTVKCPVTVSATPSSFSSSGGTGSVGVSTNRECQWSASPSGDWIQLGSPASGQGEGNVPFTIRSNGDPTVRRGAIAVGDQQIAITQEAAPCVFNVAPMAQTVSPAGERRTITVTASSAQCAWTARSDVDWLSIVSGAQGTGNGEVVFEARSTTGPTRSGTLVIAGQTVTITQGEGCSISISPASQSVGASGGSGTISVTTAPGCGWTAQSNASWIAITSGESGNGPGAVGFSVGSWDGPTRTGIIQIDGQQFTVTQTAGCSYSIDPSSQSVPTGGGSGAVNVHTASGCAWTASSNAPWLTIASGSSGSGDGRVQFTAGANTGPPRTGTLTVAGRTFTVSQDSGCTFALSASSASFDAAGGTGSVSVTAGSGCTWSAASGATWVRITQGASGTGSGEVRFSVDANTGAQRSATLTIAGRGFTVTQAGGCTFTISPDNQSFASGGGTGSIAVTTGAGCPWTASASQPWVHVTSGGSGSGSGTIGFSVDANSGSARDATITAGGRTFSVHQTAGCSYSLNPTSASITDAGGTASVSVATGSGCSWAASAPDGWVHITAGSSGIGPGTVELTVDANTAGARSSTLSIAGLAFVVSQSGITCSYAMSPTSQSFDASGGSGSFSMTAPASCAWSASSSDAWLQITSGASGSGNGTVNFTGASNTGPSRSATITAGGQTFTATQASGCTFDISPSSQDVAFAGGTGSFSVTTVAGCTWTATTADPWIHVTAGSSGSGPDTVQFSVDANTGIERTGTITVGSRTFTIKQAAAI